MVTFARFRSIWGVDPGTGFAEWRKRFADWKSQGYAGVEINFQGLSPEDLQTVRGICDEVGLQVSVMIFSSWPNYTGPRPRGLTPDVHLDFYRKQLQIASILKPVKINAQSGADYWTPDQSVYFYQKTFEVDRETGFEGKVCHETHRNRSLFNPYVADYILQKVPQLKITTDISHWVVVCERLLDVGEEDREILDRVIPHVHHIHARTGTTQASQCPAPLDPAFAEEKAFFEKFWLRVIESRVKQDPNSVITWVPEYGPFPYHPIGSVQSYSDLADNEGQRLEKLFGEKYSK